VSAPALPEPSDPAAAESSIEDTQRSQIPRRRTFNRT
jgi:hypothetical protein